MFIPGNLSLKYGDQAAEDAFYNVIIICGLDKLLNAPKKTFCEVKVLLQSRKKAKKKAV